jgi:hypothetical protein
MARPPQSNSADWRNTKLKKEIVMRKLLASAAMLAVLSTASLADQNSENMLRMDEMRMDFMKMSEQMVADQMQMLKMQETMLTSYQKFLQQMMKMETSRK